MYWLRDRLSIYSSIICPRWRLPRNADGAISFPQWRPNHLLRLVLSLGTTLRDLVIVVGQKAAHSYEAGDDKNHELDLTCRV